MQDEGTVQYFLHHRELHDIAYTIQSIADRMKEVRVKRICKICVGHGHLEYPEADWQYNVKMEHRGASC
jgi:hypothetical protein